ncbi:uncharacterized protein BJX67DRAFT_384926 [Aspergillus lucknowensis]|uniref:Uncharacterized protein n=1 Tax=Aspergillus lucknowensis TaxID=176173 RepID=A0ABR4LF59_9EURO
MGVLDAVQAITGIPSSDVGHKASLISRDAVILWRASDSEPGRYATGVVSRINSVFLGVYSRVRPEDTSPRTTLLALFKELGHEFKDLLQGPGFRKGDEVLLVEAVANQIKERPALKDTDWYQIEDENEAAWQHTKDAE